MFEKSSNPRLIFQKRAINPPEPFKKPETESKLKKVQSYQSRYYIITYIIVLVVVVVLDKKLLAHTPLILWLLTKLTNSSVLFFIESWCIENCSLPDWKTKRRRRRRHEEEDLRRSYLGDWEDL